jgi:catechol 2,3-dioxygenase-like lactoylglutathione lyase family enzyme
VRQRLDFVTIGVRDLGASRWFYVDGLGWEPTLDLPEVVFLQVGHGLILGLWPAVDMEADVRGAAGSPAQPADDPTGPGAGVPFTLAHNVDSDQAVVEALEAAAAAGATILKPAQRAGFGGFHGYFADPDGVRWEVAHNPGWSVADDGRVTLVPIED